MSNGRCEEGARYMEGARYKEGARGPARLTCLCKTYRIPGFPSKVVNNV